MQVSRCGQVGGQFGYYASLQTCTCRESSSKVLCLCNTGAAQLVDSALQGGALVAVLCNTSGFGPASGLSEAAVAALGPLAERVRVLQAGSAASVPNSFEGSLEEKPRRAPGAPYRRGLAAAACLRRIVCLRNVLGAPGKKAWAWV